MAGVNFQHVYKRYGQIETIHDFNLEIHDKEFLVLVGPSGCGKSTSLRMIAGLEDVSEGKLLIGDQVVNDVPPRDRNIAMVFQNYALYPHLSVKDNMGFSLRMKKVPRQEIDTKVQAVAEILGLDQLLSRKPKELSGGQRQRVAIGRAIVRDPKVFLFDEPLSNLDAKLRVQMRVELAKLHKRLNATIVYVTHDQIEAMTLADRIVVMKDGYIQQVGTPLELYQKPTNAFVGGFIGSPAMNQITAKITEDASAIKGNGFSIPLDAEIAKPLASHKNKDILLGIRPQDIVMVKAGEPFCFEAKAEVIELIGSESYIYFTMEDKQWVARCENVPSSMEGQTVHFSLNLENLHIFSNDGSSRLI